MVSSPERRSWANGSMGNPVHGAPIGRLVVFSQGIKPFDRCRMSGCVPPTSPSPRSPKSPGTSHVLSRHVSTIRVM